MYCTMQAYVWSEPDSEWGMGVWVYCAMLAYVWPESNSEWGMGVREYGSTCMTLYYAGIPVCHAGIHVHDNDDSHNLRGRTVHMQGNTT